MQCSGAWHVLPCFNSMAAQMAAALLGTSCLASYQLLHAMQRRLARHAWLQLNGCAHGSSITWHVMPSFVSVTACNAAAPGTSCLVSTQWLHTWQQHHLARHAKLRISYCMQCSGAWHVMPSVNSMAAHMAAASLGTSCQASYQLLHAMQWCLAHHAWLQLNGCPAYMAAASYHTISNRGPSHSGTSNSSGIRGRASGLTITTDEEASICSSSSFGSKLGQSSPSHRASHELLTMGARMQFELSQGSSS